MVGTVQEGTNSPRKALFSWTFVYSQKQRYRKLSAITRFNPFTYWESDYYLLSEWLVSWDGGDVRLGHVGVLITADDAGDDMWCVPADVKRHRDVHVLGVFSSRCHQHKLIVIRSDIQETTRSDISYDYRMAQYILSTKFRHICMMHQILTNFQNSLTGVA